MMMIQGSTSSLTNHLFPADRCVWLQDDDTDGRGYIIRNVQFFPGDAPGVTVNNARLGYIGKSGRFVPISDPFFIAILTLVVGSANLGTVNVTFSQDPGTNTNVRSNMEAFRDGIQYSNTANTGLFFDVSGSGLTRTISFRLDSAAENITGNLIRLEFTNNSITTDLELQL